MGRKGAKERARRGDGSITPYKYGFRGQLTLVDALGRKKRKSVYGRTMGEVRTKLLRLRVERKKSEHAGRELVHAYLDRWIDAHEANVGSATVRGYRSWIRTHLQPLLGHLQMRDLEPSHVQGMLDEMRRTEKSPRTRQAVLVTLKTALEQAVDWGVVERNVAQRIRAPRVPKSDKQVWNPRQIVAFLTAVHGDRLWPLYLTAIATGMRESELLGLRWRAVDLDRGIIKVERRLDAATLELDKPKTRRSEREIGVPKFVVGELKAHRKRLAAKERMTPWVFPASRNGSPLRPSNFLRYSYRPAIALADAMLRAELPREREFDPNEGVPLIPFRNLRHTAGTLLRRLGADLRTISDRMGHTSVAFTQDVYGATLPDLDREAADALDGFFSSLSESAGDR